MEQTQQLVKGAAKLATAKGLLALLKSMGWPGLIILILFLLPILFAPFFFAFYGSPGGLTGGEPSALAMEMIPEKFFPIYRAAEAEYGVPWNLLAAHHKVETNFSDSGGIRSHVGAIGPMQFMPCTWVGWSYPGCGGLGNLNQVITSVPLITQHGGYGIDANNDGKADPRNIHDAVFGAANFLARNGAGDGLFEDAIFAYNHSREYVNEVLHYARLFVKTDSIAIDSGSLVWPVPFTYNITSSFGMRIHPVSGVRKFHDGVDIAAAGIENKPVIAAASGKVARAGYMGGYGKTVIIKHGEYETLYGHLNDITVKTGQNVQAGEKIGLVGSTGQSTGPHLHFTVKMNGQAIDPMPYLNGTKD